MKSILLCTSFIFLFVITIPHDASSQGKHGRYVDVKEAQLENSRMRGLREGIDTGREEGFEEGKRKGFEEGREIGFEEGFSAGVAYVGDSILTVLHDVYHNPSPNNCGKLYDMVRAEFSSKLTMRANLQQRYYKQGELYGYQLGFRDGYESAFDSLYRLQLWHGQNIEFPKNAGNYPFVLDYEKIAQLLGTMSNRNNYVEKSLFSNALHEVNYASLEYLTGIIELTSEEKAEVFQRYEEIHAPLADQCYQQYLLLCSSLNRNFDKSFYDYKISVSTEAFLNVVLFHLAAVSDVAFTFAKTNSQYCAWKGFEIGHISEVLFVNVFYPLVDYFRKNAIRLDYNINFPLLTPVTVSLLSPIVAETRTHRKTVSETLQLSAEHTSVVKMEIETIIEVGYFLEDFCITANHRKQQVWVNISNRPRLLRVVKQDYKVVGVTNHVAARLWNITTELSKSDLNAIFESHRDPVESLGICHNPLRRDAIDIISPILVKTVEPAIAIPYSCYKVKMDFGGKTSDLISISCP